MKISYTSLKRDLNFNKDIILKAKCKLYSRITKYFQSYILQIK